MGLLIRWSGVRDPADPPAISVIYASPAKCDLKICHTFVTLDLKSPTNLKCFSARNIGKDAALRSDTLNPFRSVPVRLRWFPH